MLSLADIFRWLVGKALWVALLFVVLIAASVLASYAPEWWGLLADARDRASRLEQLRGEVVSEEVALRRLELELERVEENAPSIFSPGKWWTHRAATREIRKSIESAREGIEKRRGEIAKILTDAGGVADRTYQAFARWWPTAATIVAVVVLGPFAWRCLAFFVFAALAHRASPIQLSPADAPGHAAAFPPGRSLVVSVPGRETFYFRPGCIQQRRDASTGSTLARFWAAPLITSAARLFGLTRVRAKYRDKPAAVTLSSGDPDTFFTVLELRDHPGFVLHPRHVVGLSDGIRVCTRWEFRLHSLLTGQFRYILFVGTGRLVLQGAGGVLGEIGEQSPGKIEELAVAGFDSRATCATTRTEQAIAYIFARTPLMDDQFSGPFLFLREVAPGALRQSLLHRTFGSLFSALGKFFGF
jgi:hypothetical protein